MLLPFRPSVVAPCHGCQADAAVVLTLMNMLGSDIYPPCPVLVNPSTHSCRSSVLTDSGTVVLCTLMSFFMYTIKTVSFDLQGQIWTDLSLWYNHRLIIGISSIVKDIILTRVSPELSSSSYHHLIIGVSSTVPDNRLTVVGCQLSSCFNSYYNHHMIIGVSSIVTTIH